MGQATPDRKAGPDGARLSDDQRLDWLQLIRSEHVGPVTFRDLINHYGSAAAALEALPALAHRGGRKRAIKVANRGAVEKELDAAYRIGSAAVVAGEPGYPPWLEHIDGAPPILYVMGHVACAREPMVAIVGSRDGSAAGRKLARTLAGQLGEAGYVITSGLARGIDGEAHAAALPTGTVAVVAGGLDIIYPPEHERLHHAIAERGLIVSENPPGQPPRAQDFPRRNRIISGMAQGVVVVEAARRSGSLITARVATEQGRQVFAVPGHPLDPRAVGTNLLLKQGASLATCARDVIDALAPMDPRAQRVPAPRPGQAQRGLCDVETDPSNDLEFDSGFRVEEPAGEGMDCSLRDTRPGERARVLNALGPTPIEIDELCRTSDADIRTVRAVLLEMDLAGRLERHRNQLVSVLPAGLEPPRTG